MVEFSAKPLIARVNWAMHMGPVWDRYYAVPPEHGAWIWWSGPLLVGGVAAGRLDWDFLALAVAALSGFLLRQPLTLVVKVLSGRRSRSDLAPSTVWAVLYGAVLFAAAFLLVLSGHSRVILLGLIGLPVFAWYLWLVSRREERGRVGLDIAGAAALALTAPAGYWVCDGQDMFTPWLLWAIMAAKSSASIVHVATRLRQRHLAKLPSKAEAARMSTASLIFHAANLLASFCLAWAGLVPLLVVVAFGLMFAEGFRNVTRPAVGLRPSQIGLRQLATSTAFVVLVLMGYIF